MKVIGSIGLNGAGKDELIDYLHERCNIPELSLSDIVRDIADKEGVSPTRENLHEISKRYFARYGEDYFVKKLIEEIEANDYETVGITGIRTPTDVMTLKEHFGQNFLLVHVKVSDPHIRYERVKKRDEARDPQTYEEFMQQDKSEDEIFKISEAIKYAYITINNDGSLEEFYRNIEEKIIERGYCCY